MRRSSGRVPQYDPGPQGATGKGSWTIVSGTGSFKGLRGSGQMKVVSNPADESIGRETLTR